MGWSFQTLNHLVDREVKALPDELQARFLRIAETVSRNGLQNLPPGWSKHLEGRLWEFRMTGRDGIARAIYVTAHQRRVVVLRVFIKKTQATPLRELALARERAKEVL
jgi:phage-related protein